MSEILSRRNFIAGAMAATASAGAAAAGPLPTRVLGRTGVKVTILGFGCGSRLTGYKTEERGVEAIRLGMDLGIRYIDTAQNYGNGLAETWAGKAIQGRRKEVFLVTKIYTRDADEARRKMEESVRRLGTEQFDLIHIHGLEGEDDLAKVEAKGGLLDVVYKLRDQKVARFIGVTSHKDPATLKLALERHDFDCVQMALNPAMQGMIDGPNKMIFNPKATPSFETVTLPVAIKKNMGITAMKVAAQDELIGEGGGKAPFEKLLQYGLSLPIAAAVVGMPKLDHIRQNVELARDFKPMPRQEMRELSNRASAALKASIDRKFARHLDA